MRTVIFSLILLFGASPSWAAGQTATDGRPRRTDPQFQRDRNENTDEMRRLEREQEKQRNTQRHKDLKRDTDKLLELATELKQYVDKSNENMLSLDVLRKAEEIEKLARSVKDKMKGK